MNDQLPPTFDLFEHRATWELATLLIALVLVPGAVDATRQRLRGAPVTDAPVPARRGGRGQPVRPPRSC